MAKVGTLINYFRSGWDIQKDDTSLQIKKYTYQKKKKPVKKIGLAKGRVAAGANEDVGTKYSILFYGKLKTGYTFDQVKETLIGSYQIDPEKVEKMFEKTPALLKCHLSNANAWRLKTALGHAGILCSMVVEEDKAQSINNLPIIPLDG